MWANEQFNEFYKWFCQRHKNLHQGDLTWCAACTRDWVQYVYDWIR